MPPRYAYWTILIDDKPTAFRAREREELQPTFVQLQRKNASVTMQWFARGKLWASREAERDDFQMQKHAASAPRARGADRPPESAEGAEKRGSGWRPGGAHKDPRDRFKKKNRPERAWSEKDPATQRDRDKPGYAPRPWQTKPTGPPAQRKPWVGKPPGAAQGFSPAKPRGDRPWTKKPDGAQGFSPAKPRGDRPPWRDKPAPPSDRPWQTKPTGPRAQRKPWVGKPSTVAQGFSPAKPRGDRPWSKKPDVAQGFSPAKPRDPNRKPFTPRGPRPGGPPGDGPPRKRRDDED